ncbi:Elongator complex protein 5 [Frankliniella fusca]|uniref:Elongator complex protein 5 n=1 Tax=Frankliniella fusca TaxID=407009 RepID=A0AAE1I3L6_9NEOP|nr:Elongator complex protein 5 [Frankliniella fusca]
MLEVIRDAKLQSPFILFVGHTTDPPASRTFVCDSFHPLPDSTDLNGSSLFISLVKSYIKSSELDTHVLCWERKTLRQLKPLQIQMSNLFLHDCLSDFHGWINPDETQTGFLSTIRKILPGNSREINVVIDSLSNPFFTIGFGVCLKELQQMINSTTENSPKIQQLLCFVHGDMVPCGTSSIGHVKHLATTVVDLNNQTARITHRKPGGHVERKEEQFVLSNGQFHIQALAGTVKSSVPSNTTLPQDVASFRVSLSDKEKEDRNKLVLPYMRTGDNSQEEGGGKVFYQPDAVDDWDDEDPDDDLDI